MTTPQPIDVKNLDIYGNAALEWSRAVDLLDAFQSEGGWGPSFLGTVSSDGRPHSAGFGPAWVDGALYFVSGAGTRKSRNLAGNPACTVSMSLKGMDLIFEGTATRVTDPDLLEKLAAAYREAGWPAQVEGAAFTAPYSAPSAGPPPWQVYAFDLETAFGVASAEPYGATRWQSVREAHPFE
jgi:hypothetical protein